MGWPQYYLSTYFDFDIFLTDHMRHFMPTKKNSYETFYAEMRYNTNLFSMP